MSAAIPNVLITEYFVNFEARGREVAVAPFEVRGGYIDLPRGPGLGLDLREDALRRFPYEEFPRRSLPDYRDEGP